MTRPLRVRALLVDPAPEAASALAEALSAEDALEVVKIARDCAEALDWARRLRPDVVAIDVDSPRLDGFACARQIMEAHPLPVVAVSARAGAEDPETNSRALESGALAVVARPPRANHPGHRAAARQLATMLRLMSEVKVVRRWNRPSPARAHLNGSPRSASASPSIVAIGASTGGPIALQTILARLQPDFPLPVVIVQHLSHGFTDCFVEWLGSTTGFPVSIAQRGEKLLPGRAYMAPDGFHIGVDAGGAALLSDAPFESGMRPSVSFLFRSLAESHAGAAIGVLLTGMGRDGADELKRLRDLGAVTLVQDEASSVVYGMPRQAVLVGAAQRTLPPEGIADAINALARTK